MMNTKKENLFSEIRIYSFFGGFDCQIETMVHEVGSKLKQ
jgi:hypothetical protein